MTPKEYAAIISNKAKFGTVFAQHSDSGDLVICRGLTVGELEAIRSTTTPLKINDALLAQAVFELTCVYPEETDDISLKVAASLGKQVLEDAKEEAHKDEELSTVETALVDAQQPTFYYKMMQSLPISVALRIANKADGKTNKQEVRKGIFVEN